MERKDLTVMAVCVDIGNSLILPLVNDNDDEIFVKENNQIILTAASLLYKRKPQRIENYIERVVAGYASQQFQQNFRISIDAYEELRRIVGPDLQRSGAVGRHQIPLDKQLLSVIWLLATPDSYRSVGERFDLAKSSLSVCFVRVVKALSNLSKRIIKWPQGDRLYEVKRGFLQMAGINNVIGVVDGTYIVIKAPKEDAYSYVTRKCNYAITLQGICDHALKFTDIFVGFPGSVSETRIFRNSDIFRAVYNDHQYFFPKDEFIIGDKAYPVLTWCIPPYVDRGNLTRAQVHFNRKLAQTRQTIERALALLFGRFRRLRYVDMNLTKFIPTTVLAACVLHNICLSYDDLFQEDYIREGLPAVLQNDEVEGVYHQIQEEGRNRRNAICRELFQNVN